MKFKKVDKIRQITCSPEELVTLKAIPQSPCPLCNQKVPDLVGVEDVRRVVKAWKILNNIPTEGDESDSWNAVYFPKLAKAAKELILLFGWENAVRCMQYVFEDTKRKKLECNFWTIVKRADIYREHMARNG